MRIVDFKTVGDSRLPIRIVPFAVVVVVDKLCLVNIQFRVGGVTPNDGTIIRNVAGNG